MSEWRNAGDSAIPRSFLPNNAAAPGTATPEALLDSRQHFVQQKVLPSTHRSRIDVLVPAEPGEAIGKGDDNGGHALFSEPAPSPAELGPPRAEGPMVCTTLSSGWRIGRAAALAEPGRVIRRARALAQPIDPHRSPQPFSEPNLVLPGEAKRWEGEGERPYSEPG
jgi:hypothetical protein